ncbi:hypothetical protein CVT24_009070 [Panaeolus cyanescens]|uniref:Zn(2)-C6 fungal-type domain-containing protein n=1 Tax=Panaeolus cyanescens TaxID=181874 RepID=A0A409VEP1_9AGAR|nr:hypothetical protein CVT24_009070 [Panaeolus cyanescens]
MPRKATTSQSAKSTREKTGCLTCRIRRKKCDIQVVDTDSEQKVCKTCSRLHLECLGGYGQKRPKWLKNKTVVAHIKTLITDHLNINGLVKGIPRPRSQIHGGSQYLQLSVWLTSSGELPFPLDPGSPVSDTSSSSFDSNLDTLGHNVLSVQHLPAEQEYFVPLLEDVLQSEQAPSSLDQWWFYQQQAQMHSHEDPINDNFTTKYLNMGAS